MMNFSGKRVLVTGAGAGIGRATAQKFAQEGAIVIATDRDFDALDGMDQGSGRIIKHALDVTNVEAIKSLVAAEAPMDILFNCAGVVTNGSVVTTTRSDWDLSFSVNVTAIFEIISAFLPPMLQNGGGSIVNMASVVSSLKGAPNRFAYGASKAAVIGLSKSIAADFVSQGIRCNAICPGTVDTPSLKQRLHDTGDYETARKQFVARQPMGRLAQAEEIADLVLYLSSESASFVTGQAIAIDGGWST